MTTEFRDRAELNKTLGLILRILKEPKSLPGYQILVQKDQEDEEGNCFHHILIARPSDKTFVDLDYYVEKDLIQVFVNCRESDVEKDLIQVFVNCRESEALGVYESHRYIFRPTYDLEKQLREEIMNLIDCLFGQDASDKYVVSA